MPKKTTIKKEEVFNLDTILFKCRDILRQAKNSGSFFEKRDMMLTLVFLRFIGEKYECGVARLKNQLIELGLDPEDENIVSAFFEDATFTDGTYNLPPEARWSTLINTPGLGTRKKAKYLIIQYLAFFCLNFPHIFPTRAKNIAVSHYFFWLNVVNKLPLKRNKAY